MRNKKLAILAGCMVLYAGLPAVVDAEEAGTGETVIEEVVVSASRFKQLNPVKFTVITEEDIKAKGAQTVADALKDITGVYVTGSSTKGKKNAQIRGSDADNTKIYIDGVPLSPVGDGKVDLSNIPADSIEKIEVIKGAVPVIYGSDAPGGVIYITTKTGGDKSAQSLTVTTGTNNTETYFASIAGKKNKVSYNFGIKREDTEGYTEHSQVEANYFNGKLSWDINPKASLTVFGSYSEKQEQIPNRVDPATGLTVINPGKGGTIAGRNFFWGYTGDWEYDPMIQSYIGALYNQKLNRKSDLNFKIYQSNEKSTLTAVYKPLHVPGTAHDYWDGTVNGFELQHAIRTSGANTVTWGYSYETRTFTEVVDNGFGGIYGADYDYQGTSFYLQNVTNVNSKLATSFGYRHNENQDQMTLTPDYVADLETKFLKEYPNANLEDLINPRGADTSDNLVFSFNYALNKKTGLHGSLGTSYKFPNAKERAGVGGFVNGLDDSDGISMFLMPEEAINREMGLAHSFNSRLGIDVTYFSKDITNMIKGQGQGYGHTQYENIPHVDMHGYEAEIHQKFNKRLKAFLNYSYTNAFDPRVQAQVADIPYRKYSYGLNYVGADGVSANLAVSYIGPRRSVFSNGNGNGSSDGSGNPGEWTVETLDGYQVVDLKIGKEKENREYYLKITNLFDKKYYSGVYLIAPARYIEAGTTIKY